MQRIITLFKKQSTIFVLLLDILSVFTAVVIFREQDKPACFNLLPLMPLAYMAVSTLFRQLFDEIPDNLGATLILAFEAVKMVVIPLVIHYSNYHAYFDREYFDNMPAAVLLTVSCHGRISSPEKKEPGKHSDKHSDRDQDLHDK